MFLPRLLLVGLFFSIVLGCGGGFKEEVTNVTAIPPADVIKATLQAISQSGEDLGSGAENLQQAIDEIKKTDAAKAEALTSALKELSSARDPNARKNAAKKMIAKLGSTPAK